MQFTVDAETFAERAAIAAEAASTTDLRMIGMRVVAHTSPTDGKVTLTCRDDVRETRVDCPARVDNPGTVTVPAKLLSRVAAAVPDGDCVVDGDTPAGVLLSAASDQWMLHRMDVRTLPRLETPKGGESFQVDRDVLRDVRRIVAPCVGSSDPGSHGMRYLQLTVRADESLCWVATDSYRLAMIDQPSDADVAAELLMPAAPLAVAEKHLRGDEGLKGVATASSALLTHTFDDGSVVTHRVAAGAEQYPDWKAVLSKRKALAVVEVSRAAMFAAVAKAEVMAAGANRSLRIDFSEGCDSMTVGCYDAELGDAKAQVDCDASSHLAGKSVMFALGHLKHVLLSCPAETVRLATVPFVKDQTGMWEALFELPSGAKCVMFVMSLRSPKTATRDRHATAVGV